MNPARKCSRPMCPHLAVATLTYIYADSTAVLGPLATYAEPHCYDLCSEHSERMVPPRGWDLVTLQTDPERLKPSDAELDHLAQAVRTAGEPRGVSSPLGTVGRRGHLRVVRESD